FTGLAITSRLDDRKRIVDVGMVRKLDINFVFLTVLGEFFLRSEHLSCRLERFSTRSTQDEGHVPLATIHYGHDNGCGARGVTGRLDEGKSDAADRHFLAVSYNHVALRSRSGCRFDLVHFLPALLTCKNAGV